MEQYNISELMAAGWTPEPITDGGREIVGTDVLKFVLRRFGERRYIYPSDDITAGADDIGNTWRAFVSTHNTDIAKMFAAYNTDYSPLENYRMTEQGTDTLAVGRTHNNQFTADNTDTLTRTGTTSTETNSTGKNVDTTTTETKNTGTQTTAGTADTTNSVAAYNAAEMTNRDKQTDQTNSTRTDDLTQSTTNGGEINTQTAGTATVTNNTTDTTTYNKTETTNATEQGTDTTNHELTRSGNIGVTTSQQMLTSELILRAPNNIAYYAVELFVSQFTTW